MITLLVTVYWVGAILTMLVIFFTMAIGLLTSLLDPKLLRTWVFLAVILVLSACAGLVWPIYWGAIAYSKLYE